MSSGIHAYRNALRATKVAFRNDIPVLQKARAQIRQGFEDSRSATPEELTEQIKHMNEVSAFLIKNIVQGEKQDNGRFMLNFHEQTELGDNESIKQLNKSEFGSLAGKKGAAFKKCSD